MFTHYAQKDYTNNDLSRTFAFPLKVMLHQGKMRYFVDDETKQSLSVFWPDLPFVPATQFSAGDFTEVFADTHKFSRFDPTITSDAPAYFLPKISDQFDTAQIKNWLSQLHQGHEWEHPEPALSRAATELVKHITGTPRFDTFRLSEPMQKLKRERNVFARALSLSDEPSTSKELLVSLMDSVNSVREQETLAKEVIYSLHGASIPAVRKLLYDQPDLIRTLDAVLLQMQKEKPLRTVNFHSSIENGLRERVSYALQGLREQVAEGHIQLPAAVRMLQGLSPHTRALHPVELSDLLHQTWGKKLSEQTNLLYQMIESVHSFPQEHQAPKIVTASESAPEIPIERPKLRPRI